MRHSVPRPSRPLLRPLPVFAILGLLGLATAACLVVDSETRPATASQCAAGTLTYTFTNSCTFPVWVGQHSTDPVAPKGGGWGISPAGSIRFCMPQTWSSGTFWGRTGCSGTATDFSCATGQCGEPGQETCAVSGGTPMSPVSQFEVTSIVSGANVVANYDLSLVAGYNVPMKVQPGGGNFNGGTCATPQCTSDLNLTCPTALQDTVPVVSTPSQIPCGSGYCPEGVCVGGDTCVVGCLDPCTQCERNASAPGLDCTTQVGGLTFTDCNGSTLPVTGMDLYCAKNTQAQNGNSMASANQGTPTCFADVDCPAGSSCVTNGFASGFQPPAGSGVCIDPNNPDYKDAIITCSSATVGQACGDYLQSYALSGALGYTCQPVNLSNGTTAYPCLPPLTSGLGTCTAPDPGKTGATLYSGGGGVFNQAWVDAGVIAGGGSTPYYATFHDACPDAYAWQYDDSVGGYACSALTGFEVTFCP